MKRRHQLCHTGVEIFFENDQSVFLSFRSSSERKQAIEMICSQPGYHHHLCKLTWIAAAKLIRGELDLADMTRKWQNHALSNFDYLVNFLVSHL